MQPSLGPPNSISRLVFAIVFVIGAVLVGGLVPEISQMLVPAWALLVLLVGTAILIIARHRDSAGPFSLLVLFSLVYLVGFVGRGASLSMGEPHHIKPEWDSTSEAFRELVVSGLLLAELGLVAVFAGYGLGPQIRGFAARLERVSGRLFLDTTAFWTVVLTLGAACATGVALYLLTVSSPGQLLQGSARGATDTAFGAFYVYALVNFGLVAQLLLVVRWFAVPDHRRLVLLTGSGLTLVLAAFSVLSGMKVLLLTLALGIAVAYHLLRRRLRYWHLVVGFLLFASTFPFFYAVRDVGFSDQLPDRLSERYGSPGRVVQPFLGRLYSLDSTILAVDWIESGNDLLYGSSLASLPVFLIPRSLWPDKPLSFGLVFGRTVAVSEVYSADTFVTPSLIGELFLDGHVVGVVLGCFLVGILLKVASSPIQNERMSLISVAMYPVVAVRLTQLVEGPIASHLELLLLDLAVFVLALVIATLASRSGVHRTA